MNKAFISFCNLFLILTIFTSCCEKTSVQSGRWEVSYDDSTAAVDVYKDGTLLFDNLYATYRDSSTIVSSKDYSRRAFDVKSVDNHLGKGICYSVEYTDDNMPMLVQSFYLYPEKDYLLTDITLQADTEVATNYMAAINIDTFPAVL